MQVHDIGEEKWEELLCVDQLRAEMAARRVFLGFSEAPIAFAPTFKVRVPWHACTPSLRLPYLLEYEYFDKGMLRACLSN